MSSDESPTHNGPPPTEPLKKKLMVPFVCPTDFEPAAFLLIGVTPQGQFYINAPLDHLPLYGRFIQQLTNHFLQVSLPVLDQAQAEAPLVLPVARLPRLPRDL